MAKLAQIEKKVIVGGENLLDKSEEQAKLLEESNKELEERRLKENELRKALEQKQVGTSPCGRSVTFSFRPSGWTSRRSTRRCKKRRRARRRS